MVVGNKRYCDECNSDDAERYAIGLIKRDYCLKCAIKLIRNMNITELKRL